MVPLVVAAVVIPLLGMVPWPSVDLPSIPWPNLPSIPWPNLPSIPWPDLPDVDLPDWQLPGWLRWVLDHAKYVVPVLVAWAVAQREIKRRRQQLEKREAEQRGGTEE